MYQSSTDWQHVEPAENPADRAHRVVNADQMFNDKIWRYRDQMFCGMKKTEWPQASSVIDLNAEKSASQDGEGDSSRSK